MYIILFATLLGLFIVLWLVQMDILPWYAAIPAVVVFLYVVMGLRRDWARVWWGFFWARGVGRSPADVFRSRPSRMERVLCKVWDAVCALWPGASAAVARRMPREHDRTYHQPFDRVSSQRRFYVCALCVVWSCKWPKLTRC